MPELSGLAALLLFRKETSHLSSSDNSWAGLSARLWNVAQNKTKHAPLHSKHVEWSSCRTEREDFQGLYLCTSSGVLQKGVLVRNQRETGVVRHKSLMVLFGCFCSFWRAGEHASQWCCCVGPLEGSSPSALWLCHAESEGSKHVQISSKTLEMRAQQAGRTGCCWPPYLFEICAILPAHRPSLKLDCLTT